MTQIAVFLMGVYTVTRTLCLLLRPAAMRGELWVLLAWLLPTVWSPTIIALALTLWSSGAAGIRCEIRRLSYSRGSSQWLVVASVFPVLTTAIAVFSARAVGDSGPFTPPDAILTMVVMQIVTGAVGEELGWRGFLLPRLEKRIGKMMGAWLMAILWGLWHVAGMMFPGMPLQVVPPVLFLLSVAFFGIFLAFVFNRTGGSVLATIFAHLSFNIALGAGGVRLSSPMFWWVVAGIYGASAVLITIASPISPPCE